MSKIVEALMDKAPAPDDMGEAEPEETPDAGAEASAMEDFVSALGLSREKAAAALPALRELIRACAKGDAY